jgi:hypothetical protein
MQVGLVSKIKGHVVPHGKAVRSIQGGALRGIRMNLDLAYETQMYLGLAEREIHAALTQFSREVRTAIDIGSAFGEYTLFFLTKTPAQRVFAFDPEPRMQGQLYENLRLNGIASDPRLQFSPKYVGKAADEKTITLDLLIPEIEFPCIVKVDVDGSEVDVLRGARLFLGIDGVRWIIETHSKQLEADCVVLLRNAGYLTSIVPNAWWRTIVPEQRPIELNRWLLATKISQNLY